MKNGKKTSPSKKPIPKAKATVSVNDRLYSNQLSALVNKYSFYILIAVLLVLVLIVFKDFLTFKSLYLFKDIGSDSLNLAYPRIYHLCEYLRTEGLPSWSHYQGMGQSIFPFSLNNPFEWILFTAGVKYFPYLIAYVEVIKVLLGGILFFYYLKMMKVQGYISLLGGVFYAFSGFMILGSGWNIFSTEAVYLVFLMISFETLYNNKNILLFPVAIALIGAMQPFNLYLYGVFILIYSFVRLFDTDKLMKDYVRLYLKMALLGLIGLGISAVFVLTELDQIAESPRMGGDASYSRILKSQPLLKTADSKENATNILRFYSNDITGTGSKFRGTQNYLEAPLFYCGLLNLLLFTQFLALFNRKRKIVFGGLFFLLLIPLVFPYFRYTFWLFTGDYFRTYSFFVAMFILMTSLMCLKEISEQSKINLPLLIVTFLLLITGLYFPYSGVEDNFIDLDLRLWVTLFLIVYAVSLYFLSVKKHSQRTWMVICIFSCIEIGVFSYITVNKRDVLSSYEMNEKTGYNDFTADATDYINARDKTFFRVMKDYTSGLAIHASLNDSKIQHYRSSLSYNPFNQKYYIRFLQETGIIEKGNENSTRWATGLVSRPVLQEFANNKYYITKDTVLRDNINIFLYQKINRIGNVTIFKNKYFLPLGYTYDKHILISDYYRIKKTFRDFAFLKAFIIEDSLAGNYSGIDRYIPVPDDTVYTVDKFLNDFSGLVKDTLKISTFTHSTVSGSIELKRRKLIFFTIPFDKGWEATIDGVKIKPLLVNIGFMGFVLDKGMHSLNLAYKQPFLDTGSYISIISVVLFIGIAIYWFVRKRYSGNKQH